MNYLLDPIRKHYIDFNGRANRTQFWLWALWLAGISIALQILVFIGAMMDSGFLSGLFSLLLILFGLGTILPGLSITARRLHDIDRSAWWMLIALVPFIGAIVLLIFELLPGTPGENRFGQIPQ